MKLFDFSIGRFGAVNIQKWRNPQEEVIIGSYEFEFYTEDCTGGTLTDGKFRPARKREYSLFRPGQHQQLVPPYKCYFMNITTRDPELIDFLDRLPDNGPVWDMESVIGLLRDMMATQNKNAIEGRLGIESCVCRILSLLAAQRLTREPEDRIAFLHRDKLMAADRYIREHLAEEVTLERLADMSNLDATYFHKLYTKAYGQTPYQRLLGYRIAAAKVELQESEVSVGEVAGRCGFSSASYFSCKFKEVTGKTPLQFRKQFLKRQGR